MALSTRVLLGTVLVGHLLNWVGPTGEPGRAQRTEPAAHAQTAGHAPALAPSALQVALATRRRRRNRRRLSEANPGGARRLAGLGSASAAPRAWAPGSRKRRPRRGAQRAVGRRSDHARRPGGCEPSAPVNGGSLRRRRPGAGSCRRGVAGPG